MSRAKRRAGTVIALLGALTLVAGCGSDNAVRGGAQIPVPEDLECFDGAIRGAGSSAQELAMQVWISALQTACDDARIYYDAIGSGGGRNQFIDGAVDFAGSDAAMDEGEQEEARQRCDSDVIHLPAYVVPIAVAFNLEGIDSLNLTPDTLARLFSGDITRWNDPAIAETNPDVDLPDLPVVPVSRSDESGTTENFTAYLAAAAPDAWPHDPDGQWPFPPVEAGQGNSGVAQAIRGGQGTIGYLEASHAEGMATVRVARGTASSPRRRSLRHGSYRSPRGGTAPPRTTTPWSWTTPLPKPTLPHRAGQLRDRLPVVRGRATAEGVRTFLSYLLSAEGQEAASQESGSAPLDAELRAELLESVAAIGTH